MAHPRKPWVLDQEIGQPSPLQTICSTSFFLPVRRKEFLYSSSANRCTDFLGPASISATMPSNFSSVKTLTFSYFIFVKHWTCHSTFFCYSAHHSLTWHCWGGYFSWQHFFHDAYFAEVLQMNILFRWMHYTCTFRSSILLINKRWLRAPSLAQNGELIIEWYVG